MEDMECSFITFGIGAAGTGKTFCATAFALNELFSKRVEKIILTRPAVEAGENLGFLPGDLQDKIDPYLFPLYDSLDLIVGKEKRISMIEQGQIEIAPLAYMRGRTLNEAVVILDEAQNTTASQMKMLLTRIGKRTKAVINGDMTQNDLKRWQTSGLADAVYRLEGIEGISVSRFETHDVVRHKIVQAVIDAYDDDYDYYEENDGEDENTY